MNIRELVQKAREDRASKRFMFFHHDAEDVLARFILVNMLVEAHSLDLGKGRQVMFHRAHVPNTQDHLHFLQRGAKLYALNRDGSAHDASHGKQMHRWAMDAVRTHYGDFTIPSRGLIESLTMQTGSTIRTLVESSLSESVLLDRNAMRLAELEAART